MKVLLLNGSPHAEGCTFTALSEVAKTLQENEIETEIMHVINGPSQGCIACHKCRELDRCVFDKDAANRIIEGVRRADGLVIGSPVYYAGPNGAFCALLDRAFYAASHDFRNKPGAAVVSCRRAGSTAALDRLNKYFTISRMPVVPSQYWNMVHGNTPEEVARDGEGLQTMRVLGREMAFLLKSFEAASLVPPEKEKRIRTNFIRD